MWQYVMVMRVSICKKACFFVVVLCSGNKKQAKKQEPGTCACQRAVSLFFCIWPKYFVDYTYLYILWFVCKHLVRTALLWLRPVPCRVHGCDADAIPIQKKSMSQLIKAHIGAGVRRRQWCCQAVWQCPKSYHWPPQRNRRCASGRISNVSVA